MIGARWSFNAFLGIMMLTAGACTGGREAGSRRGGASGPERGSPFHSGGMGQMMSGRMPMMGSAPADTAAAPHPTAAPTPATGTCPATGQALVDQGRRIFDGAGNCFACHGPTATGTQVAPNLTDEGWLNIDGSYGAIIALIRSGVPHPKQYPAPMPPLGGAQLSNDQLCAIAAYVYSLQRR
jgi:mono/diheme cytochrome c family protein